jgi:hypothetical protein
MRAPTKSLWRHRDFLKLWSAQTTSSFGSQIASLAYPRTAIIVLQATIFQVGLLQATGTASAALVGLFAGVITERARRTDFIHFGFRTCASRSNHSGRAVEMILPFLRLLFSPVRSLETINNSEINYEER